MKIRLTSQPLFLSEYYSKFLKPYRQSFFGYDAVWILGVWSFPLQENNVWQLWDIDENVKQLVDKEVSLLLLYLFMKIKFSISTLSAFLIILV